MTRILWMRARYFQRKHLFFRWRRRRRCRRKPPRVRPAILEHFVEIPLRFSSLFHPSPSRSISTTVTIHLVQFLLHLVPNPFSAPLSTLTSEYTPRETVSSGRRPRIPSVLQLKRTDWVWRLFICSFLNGGGYAKYGIFPSAVVYNVSYYFNAQRVQNYTPWTLRSK